jgi:hypothetical protein
MQGKKKTAMSCQRPGIEELAQWPLGPYLKVPETDEKSDMDSTFSILRLVQIIEKEVPNLQSLLTRSSMSNIKVFIFKSSTVDAFSAGTIAIGKVCGGHQ